MNIFIAYISIEIDNAIQLYISNCQYFKFSGVYIVCYSILDVIFEFEMKYIVMSSLFYDRINWIVAITWLRITRNGAQRK